MNRFFLAFSPLLCNHYANLMNQNREQRHLNMLFEHFSQKDRLPERILVNGPVVIFAVGLISGIIVQQAVPFAMPIWLAVMIFCTFCALLSGIFKISHKLYIAAGLSFICFACLGATRLTCYQTPTKGDIRNFVDKPVLASIRAVVISEPYVVEKGNWHFAKFSHSLPFTSFLMKLEQIKTTTGWVKSDSIVRMYIGEKITDIKAGDHLGTYCRLSRFTGASNPGQFDKAEYMRRKNIFVSASVETRAGIEISGNEKPGHFARLRNIFRAKASEALAGDLSADNETSSILAALLLGKRSGIDRQITDAFIKTGLYHFVSLSGLHVGIFLGLVWWLCRRAGLMKPARAIVCLIFLGVFVMVVPPRAPTMRAAVICLFYCAGLIINRKLNPYNALALAAMAILLVRPTEIFNVGFQLSFTTVLGILLFVDKIYSFLPEFSKKWGVGYAANLLYIGLAAWLGGAPILLYNFYTITPLASLWTVIAFPFVALSLVFGLLKILLSFLLPTASVLLGYLVTGLAEGFIWIVESIAKLEINQILIGSVGLGFVLCCYLLLLFARFARLNPEWIKKTICISGTVGIIFFLGVTKYHNTKHDNLQLTVLSVGHGQCVFAALPGGANLIFDAGSLSMSDLGSKIVRPFLAKKGINKIDAIFVSHNNIDHLNAVPEIVEQHKIGYIYTPEPVLKRAESNRVMEFLDDFLREKNQKLLPIPAKIDFGGSTEISVLWPCPDMADVNNISENDISQVTLIEFAGIKILLCSDIEHFGQEQLLKKYPQLKADVVLLPHHGSEKTLTADFADKLGAKVQIASCGMRDYEKRTVKSKEVLFTPADGAVTITVSKDGDIKTETYLSASAKKQPRQSGAVNP